MNATATQVSASPSISLLLGLTAACPRQGAHRIGLRTIAAGQLVDDFGCDLGGKVVGAGERFVLCGCNLLLGCGDLVIELGIELGALLIGLARELVACRKRDRLRPGAGFRELLLIDRNCLLGCRLEALGLAEITLDNRAALMDDAADPRDRVAHHDEIERDEGNREPYELRR